MSSTDNVEQELRNEFGPAVDSNEVLQACVDICHVYSITPETLRFKWEAMNYNTTLSIRILDIKGARDLRASIKRELENKADAANKARLRAMNAAKARGAGRAGRLFSGPKFNVKQEIKNEPESSNSALLKGISSTNAYGFIFNGPDAKQTRPYRYMYERQSERSERLDKRIDKFAKMLQQHYDLDDLGDPAVVTESEVVVVGRLVGDTEGKLSEASLALESSRMMGSGMRTPLKFNHPFTLQSGAYVNLFPGMIFAARGKNGGGGYFAIQDVIDFPFPKQKYVDAASIDPFTVVVASGPYTPEADKDLQYKPFINILASIRRAPPAVLVLLGPFLDATHPALIDGSLDQDPQSIFYQRFGRPLQAFCQHCPSCRVILVSSTRELMNPHYVFPQGAFEPDGLGLPQSVLILPNPSSFTINGVRFALSTVDVLFHMRKEGLTKKSSVAPQQDPPDTMLEFCRQLIAQRSFYPVFPVPKDYTRDVNLDVSHSTLLDFESFFEEPDAVPDILIIPSVLKQFHKVVEHVNFVNPPSILKSGLIAKLAFQPTGLTSLAESLKVTFDNLNN